MKVEIVLTEADITQEFVEAMEARDLPEKFFYWFPRSAAEWCALANDTALYGGLGETWIEIGDDEAPALARHFGGSVPVISLGAGDGSRDRILMSALKDAGCECIYYPIDASQSMIEAACAGAEDDDFEATGIKADISSPVHLIYAADAAEAPRLFIFSGNTMGAFDPISEIRYVAQCMKPGDRLIIDGEIYDAARSMGHRDNPAARKFLSSLLASVGIEHADGEITFQHKTDARHEGLHLFTRGFHAGNDLSATVAGREISLERNEHIGLNFNYTYTVEAFRWLISDHGGLEILKEHRSPDGRFLTVICKK
ncbi:MAG TPA: L-histidine N(alpha)-methyltransferase [Bryobacteraceae bacterium]|nr:L-histidine N(alpha)-methyltransferase [Bryobacteraceae bacterium]